MLGNHKRKAQKSIYSVTFYVRKRKNKTCICAGRIKQKTIKSVTSCGRKESAVEKIWESMTLLGDIFLGNYDSILISYLFKGLSKNIISRIWDLKL